MCGRFAHILPNDAMAQLFAARPSNTLPSVPNYNVCPTNSVAAVRTGVLGRELVSMRWGFLPHWYAHENDGPLMINARAETIAQKPAFAEACRTRRCILPADGFYEWTKDAEGARLPWYFQRSDAAPIAFAGIWQDWGAENTPTCAIVTTSANARIQHLHHRMPLILDQSNWALWLGEAGTGAARLMAPGPEDLLAFHRVHPRVNSNRAEGCELIEPFEDEVLDHAEQSLDTADHTQDQGELF